MLKEERAASRAICDAATDGPWGALPSSPNPRIMSQRNYNKAIAITGGLNNYGNETYYQALADAKFCAHARTALPAALDALDEMEADLSHWKDEYAALMDVCENHVGAYEAMIADPKLPRDIKVNHSIYRKGIPLSTLLLGIENLGKTFDRIWDDRDQWKAQTEARDRALKAWCCRLTCKNADLEYICDENRCKNIKLAEVSGNWECVNWQFDQERFGSSQNEK